MIWEGHVPHMGEIRSLTKNSNLNNGREDTAPSSHRQLENLSITSR